MAELDLAAASAGAAADLTGVAAESAQPTPVETQTPTATPTQAAPEPTPTEPTPTPEEYEEIVYKGQSVQVPKTQVKDFIQKGYDYTQKTMALAEERRQLQTASAQLQQQLAAIQEVMSDPAKQAELAQWMRQNGMQTEANEPTDIPTIQQTQQLIQDHVKQVKAQLDNDLARAKYEIETNRLEQEYTAKINNHLNEILTKYEVLKDTEGIERLLRDEVALGVKLRLEQNPNAEIPLEDTLKMFSKAAERRATAAEKRVQERLKALVAKNQQVTKSGIEPPGGATPTPTPASQPKLGSKELRDQVYKDLLAASQS